MGQLFIYFTCSVAKIAPFIFGKLRRIARWLLYQASPSAWNATVLLEYSVPSSTFQLPHCGDLMELSC